MKRVLVIGSPGAGKSTFAEQLAVKSGLPLWHLDSIWHRADRTTVSRDEFDRRLDYILSGDKWIVDGDYQRTLARRMERCDTLFFFNLPVDECLAGAEARRGRRSIGMPWQEDVPDENLRRAIMEYPERRRNFIEPLLQGFGGRIIRFSSRADSDAYLSEL